MHPYVYVFRAFPTRVPHRHTMVQGISMWHNKLGPLFQNYMTWAGWCGVTAAEASIIKLKNCCCWERRRDELQPALKRPTHKPQKKNDKMGEADSYGFLVTKRRCPQHSAGIVSADVGDSGEVWVPRRRRAAADPGACWVQSTDPSRNLGPAWQRRQSTTQDTKLHYAAAARTPCSFTQF